MEKDKLKNSDFLKFFEEALTQNDSIVKGYKVAPVKSQRPLIEMLSSILYGFKKDANKSVAKEKQDSFNDLLKRYVKLEVPETYKGKFPMLKIKVFGVGQKLKDTLKKLDIELNPERKSVYEEPKKFEKKIIDNLEK